MEFGVVCDCSSLTQQHQTMLGQQPPGAADKKVAGGAGILQAGLSGWGPAVFAARLFGLS